LRHAALRLRQLEANHPDRPPTLTAVCMSFSFQIGVMRQIAQLFIRKGDRVEFFQVNAIAEATEWLRGQGSTLQS